MDNVQNERIDCFLKIKDKEYAAYIELDCSDVEKSIDKIQFFCDCIFRTYTNKLGLIDQDTSNAIEVVNG